MLDLGVVFEELSLSRNKSIGRWDRFMVLEARRDMSDPLGSAWYVGYQHQNGLQLMVSDRMEAGWGNGRIKAGWRPVLKTEFEFDSVAELFASMRDGDIAAQAMEK